MRAASWPIRPRGVYGLGCLPWDMEAVARINELKNRSPAAGFILLAADREQVLPLIVDPGTAVWRRVEQSWPGPVTWVFRAREDVPSWLTGGCASIAVRVTAHRVACALAEAAGTPIVSTSANRSGRRPARSSWRVRRIFANDIDYVLGGACGGHDGPSEIRDASTGEILRS